MEQHLYSWGWGGFGQLGHNSQSDVLEPSRIDAPWGPDVHPVKFGGGEWHSAIVLSDGSAYTCGYGRHGAIAQGHTSSVLTFSKVRLNEFIVDVSCGQTHTIFLTKSGKVYACGWSGYGQLGLGNTDYYVRPTVVPIGNADVIRVATRGHLTYFLTSDGKVFRTGFSEHIGGRKLSPKLMGTLPFRASDCIVFECPATRVPEGQHWGDILIVSASGDVYTRVASGSVDRAKFIASAFYRDLCKQHGSSIQTATLTYDQAVLLLHNGTLLRLNSRAMFPAVLGEGYEQVACGNRHIMALHSSGNVHVWGRNDKGQHGIGHTKAMSANTRKTRYSVVIFHGQTDLGIRSLFAGPDYNFVLATPMDSLHAALSKVCDSEAYTDLTLAVSGPTAAVYTRRVHSSIVTATQPRLFTLLTDRATAGIASSSGDDQDWVQIPGQALGKDDGDGDDVVTQGDVWLLSPDVDVGEDMVEKFVKMLYGHYLSGLSEEQLTQVESLCRAADITPAHLDSQHTRLFESPLVMRQHARNLYNNIEGSDVTLIVDQEEGDNNDDDDDGDADREAEQEQAAEPGKQVIIRAHRYLLAARSPYFAGMFRAGARFNEGNSSEIVLPATFGVEATLNVLRFMYGTPTAEMELQPDVAFGMLQAGLYLLIADVTTDTDLLEVIHRGFDVENIVYIHTLACDNELTWLQHRCEVYMVIHYDVLHQHESYASLPPETRSVVESRVKQRERSHQLRLQERLTRHKKRDCKRDDDDTDTDTYTEYDTDSDNDECSEQEGEIAGDGKGKTRAKPVPKKKKRRKEGKGHRGKKKVNLGLGIQHIFGMFKRWGRALRKTGDSSGSNA